MVTSQSPFILYYNNNALGTTVQHTYTTYCPLDSLVCLVDLNILSTLSYEVVFLKYLFNRYSIIITYICTSDNSIILIADKIAYTILSNMYMIMYKP